MPKILIIGNYPPPFGGVPAFIKALVPDLINTNYDVLVCSGGNPDENRGSNPEILKCAANKTLEHILIVFKLFLTNFKLCFRYGIHDLREMLAALLTAAIVIKHNKNLDIVLSMHILRNGFAGFILSKHYMVPHVVINFGEIYRDLNKFKKLCGIISFIAENADKLISVSEHCSKSFMKLGINITPQVIPVGIDCNRFNRDLVMENMSSESNDDIHILYMARQTKEMGLGFLLENIELLLNRYKNVKFTLAGGRGELTHAAQDIQLKYPKYVNVLTNVPYDIQPTLYAIANIVVVPSSDQRACMGMAIKEGMASKCIVIASDVGGIPEAIIDSKNGYLFKCSDNDDFIKKISYVIEHFKYLDHIKTNARKTALNKYNSFENNKEIISILSKML